MLYFDGTKSYDIGHLPKLQPQQFSIGSVLTSAEDAYRRMPVVHACVTMRTRMASDMPLSVYRGNSSRDAAGTPQGMALIETVRDLVHIAEGALCMYGRAFFLQEQKRLRYLHPRTINPIWDSTVGIKAYERTNAGKRALFDPEDILAIFLPSAENEVGWGTPPVEVALPLAQLYLGLMDFARSFVDRGAVRATLLRVSGNPSPTAMNELSTWWKRLMTGVAKADEVSAIRAEVDPVVIGDSLSELINKELMAELTEKICAAMGVPKTVIIADAANYATAHIDKLDFHENTVVPQTQLILRQLNREWLEPLGWYVEARPDRLEVFQQSQLDQATTAINLFQAGIITQKEARSLMGYAAEPDEELPA